MATKTMKTTMMKKRYDKPEMKVYNIQPSKLICTSNDESRETDDWLQ